jgi:hypothetical protein
MLERENRFGGTMMTEESTPLDEPSAAPFEWDQWSDRIESMIERYPWPTLLLAMGVGYVIARRMR